MMMTIKQWMRKHCFFLALLVSTFLVLIACLPQEPATQPPELRSDRPRVLITTDINIGQGDPDDRQSMAHLLMYADEVNIRGIIPHRFLAGGVKATMLAIDAYEQDYNDTNTRYKSLGYPAPDALRATVARHPRAARRLLIREAQQATADDPLYVLVWGNMRTLRDALLKKPAIADRLRVLSIGTHLRSPWDNACHEQNWNGSGREEIYSDPRFNHLWWIENDWTFEGMFQGDAPQELLEQLKGYGALGRNIWDVVQPFEWARYFRAGDTPSLLYVLDPNHSRDKPTQGSWAGQFYQPFPETRPNYYTDIHGGNAWDYQDPCRTWTLAQTVYKARVQTLLDRRPMMYEALITKLNRLYNQTSADERFSPGAEAFHP
ncbi:MULTISPECIES: nucleoside hydrolase-like domain-containing protein [unclassified Leptolyngbya]|uniref:nucleoside hydrolase-like domain-containing protein n=1 Tax=unclassified Leptolyngbya TaxID=2650499 RepID=UPI001688CF5C|nr:MULTISPECIES: nucleoside hydrolase-like domain-containing protein [unclassified Leptolyngbya]MBD1911013.1 DUF1593 domain-containing protein [Leptolyngbya sp. FACHB-8]MBD2158320.1 DUF1593 domain-containing protein [Leptolyngbya sp. FACHB-16]